MAGGKVLDIRSVQITKSSLTTSGKIFPHFNAFLSFHWYFNLDFYSLIQNYLLNDYQVLF